MIFGAILFFTSPTWNKFWHSTINHEQWPPPEEVKSQPEPAKAATAQALGPSVDSVKKAAAPVAVASADTVKSDTIWVENDKVIAGIDSRGARIISLKMKEYRRDHAKGAAKDGAASVDIIPPASEGGTQIRIDTVSYDKALFAAENIDGSKKVTLKGNEKRVVSFVYRDQRGGEIRKKFLFAGDGYKIGMTVSSNAIMDSLRVSWPCGIAESENTKVGFYSNEQRAVHYYGGQEVFHFKTQKAEEIDSPESGDFRWVGVSSKYFFIALVGDTVRENYPQRKIKIFPLPVFQEKPEDGKKNKQVGTNYSFFYEYPVKSDSAVFWIFAGPSQVDLIKTYDLEFQKILFPVFNFTRHIYADHWFPPIAEFVHWLLLILFKITHDYGVAIVILTILSKVVTYPLTQSSMKKMNRMKDLQPKITALRQKYKGNPQKLNAEMMALYKTEGVNPLDPGCLPMFLQMPVFIALFVVLQKAIELRGAGTFFLPWVHDLSRPEQIFSLAGILGEKGLPIYGANFAILPIIMAALTFFQQKRTIKDPNQKMMIYFMPIFMLVLFNSFPAGLVLYWTFQNGLGLVQQYLLDKKTAEAKAVTAKVTVPVPTRNNRKKR
jgi:YidC/Oxa1 family membrane protein insertase